jgi:phosphoglycolate phosphatase-like HAD superfamily hydrolase
MAELPPISVDLDGVVVRPPFGLNVVISRSVGRPLLGAELREPSTRVSRLRALMELGRFGFRRPLPGVREALAELATLRTVHFLSARSHAGRRTTERWLERNGLLHYATAVHLSPGGVPSRHFKLRTVQALGITEHVDDDPGTADYLARHAGVTVYLCDWPRSRGLDFPKGVVRVEDLAGVTSLLRGGTV